MPKRVRLIVKKINDCKCKMHVQYHSMNKNIYINQCIQARTKSIIKNSMNTVETNNGHPFYKLCGAQTTT